MSRDHGTAVLRVKDAGVGIAPKVLPLVFELFTQIDASLERSQGGLGVGLALVKRLVELHDGSVEALSEGLGKGAEFSVRLPILPESNATAPLERHIEAPSAAAVPLRILVVDDNIDAAKSLELVLKLSGHAVVSAYSGTDSLEAARGQRPDVIFLDIAMPGLNGYQIAERLRSSPDTKDIVLIATTGYGQDEDRQRAIQSGFDHHLVKPVEFKVVEELLASVAQRLGNLQRAAP